MTGPSLKFFFLTLRKQVLASGPESSTRSATSAPLGTNKSMAVRIFSGLRPIERGTLVVGLAALANTGATAFLASAARLVKVNDGSAAFLPLHSKGSGTFLRQDWPVRARQYSQLHHLGGQRWGSSIGGQFACKDEYIHSYISSLMTYLWSGGGLLFPAYKSDPISLCCTLNSYA